MIKSLIFSVFSRLWSVLTLNRKPALQPVRVKAQVKHLRSRALLLLLAVTLAPAALLAQVPDGVYPNTTDAQGRKQGAWKKLDEQGTVIYVGQFKDDKPYGLFTYFDTEGFKMTEMDFGNGTTNVQRAKMFYIDG